MSDNNLKDNSIDVKHAVSQNSKSAGALLSEIQLQALCFQWAWNNYPQARRLFAHVPNGGSRNKIEAGQLKASGVIPGVYDMFFFWNHQLYWFEMKVGSNKQSQDQVLFAEAMKHHGAICHEIRDLQSFQNIFKSVVQ